MITGNTVAQIIPISISPILTRIYTPEDFGILGIYIAIMAILSSFSNGQYHIAIVLPVNSEKAYSLAALSLIINTFISISLLLFVIIFHKNIIQLTGNNDLNIILYLIPLSFFILGIYNIYTYLCTREKKYSKISNSIILRTLSTSVLQVCSGLLRKDALFLILGNIIGFLLSTIYLIRKFKINKIIVFNTLNILNVAKRYSDFPKINIFNNLLYNLSQYLVHVFITFTYEIKYVGFYTLIQRIMLTPTSIIGKSISQVFFQHMKDSQKFNNQKKIFFETLKILIIISGIIFSIIYIYIEDIFLILFGENWIEAGEMAKILIPLFFTQFIRSSINTITMIYEKQKEQMFINLAMLFVIILVFSYSYLLNVEIKEMLTIFTFILSLINISIIIYYSKLIRSK